MLDKTTYRRFVRERRINSVLFYLALTLLIYSGVLVALFGLRPVTGGYLLVTALVSLHLYWRGRLISRDLYDSICAANEKLAGQITSRIQNDYIDLHRDYMTLLEKYSDLWEYCERLREFSKTAIPSSSLIHKQ